MGEAEEKKKKPQEEKKQEMAEEKKPASGEEKKQGENPKDETPPPQEIVLKVFMHCEGCAKKVKRSLKGFPGVEDVITDSKSHKVLVKGEKADPVKVIERIQRKSHRKVELISPAPEGKAEKPKAAEQEQKKKKKEEVVVEAPQVVTVVLNVYMHCEACSLAIKKRILRIKGVESVETDLKSSLVTVVGVLEPAKLVEYIVKRTGKHAAIIKQEPKKEEEKVKEEDKKGSENEAAKKTEGAEDESEKKADAKDGGDEDSEKKKLIEVNRNEFYYYPAFYAPKYTMDHQFYGAAAPPPPPQLFSDENPNACSVM